jgi:very-short-patch-repair endonuclease
MNHSPDRGDITPITVFCRRKAKVRFRARSGLLEYLRFAPIVAVLTRLGGQGFALGLTSPSRGGRKTRSVFRVGEMANTFARILRQNGTDAERILWARLRELKQIDLHFRRQVPFEPYVVDFCCHSAKLIVELDGDQHGTDAAIAYDAHRTAYLNTRGYAVLRFANWEVMRDLHRVVDAIVHASRAPHPKR